MPSQEQAASDSAENSARLKTQQMEFWMKVAGITFGLWSLSIPFGVTMVREAIREVVQSQERFQVQFNQYVLVMERRVTLIEERQGQVLQRLSRQEERNDLQNGNGSGK